MTTIQGTSNRFYESVSGFGSMDNHGYGCGSASGYGAPSQPPLSPPPNGFGAGFAVGPGYSEASGHGDPPGCGTTSGQGDGSGCGSGRHNGHGHG